MRSVAVARAADERGIAVLAVMVASTLLLALGVSLALTTSLEVGIAANQRDATQTFHAADAAIEWATGELARTADWNMALSGAVRSAFDDGGRRVVLPDGSPLDVTAETNRLRCDRVAPCGDAAMDASTAARPWGRNNPRWQRYASGRLGDLLPDASVAARVYVVVWVADDPSENDAQPLHDGGAPAVVDTANSANPGRDAIWLHACAYGASGTRRAIDVILERDPRSPPSRVRVRTWRETS